MIHITRLAEPPKLTEKREAWVAAFLEKRAANSSARPSSKQYGHKEILETLWAMSNGKCFYCEGRLSGIPAEVDHFVAVSEDPRRAFDWNNLYLACKNCNGKLLSISNADCLDPCNGTVHPADHLTFDDEVIREKDGSSLGLHTIKKYKLNSERMELLRSKTLHQLKNLVIRILDDMRNADRRALTTKESESLLAFTQPTHQHSLMCKVHLDRLPLP